MVVINCAAELAGPKHHRLYDPELPDKVALTLPRGQPNVLENLISELIAKRKAVNIPEPEFITVVNRNNVDDRRVFNLATHYADGSRNVTRENAAITLYDGNWRIVDD